MPAHAAVVSRIYRPEPSAASFFLGAVSDALRDAGFEVDVYTVVPPRGSQKHAPSERVRTFPVLRDRNGYVRGYVQYMSFDIPLFFRLLFARRPSVVFVEPPPTTGAVVRMVCAIRRIPYVYDTADIWSDAAGHATSSGLVVRVLRGIERFALRGAAALVTISQGVADRVRTLGVLTPVAVTGFGADTTAFAYTEAPIEPVFIYAGTFTGLHGAEILVDAFADFSRSHPGYRLHFIGNGTHQQEMRDRAAELGIAPHALEFSQPIAATELSSRLSSATASLATLRPGGGYEYAFTSKVYSSLAAGCPVIFAGPGPTVQFLEGAAARRIPAGPAVSYASEAIARAMRDAAENPLPPAARQQLADWIAADHSMQTAARRVCEVIVAVSSRKPER